MPKFTVRVELHGVRHDSEEYSHLHEEMEARGFSRTIKGKNGILYHLPPAEYNRQSSLSIQKVRDSAKEAAETTGKKFAVLVTQGRRSWAGLTKVE